MLRKKGEDETRGWLDRQTYSLLERQRQEVERKLERHFLCVHLPQFEHSVLHHTADAAVPLPPAPRPAPAARRRSTARAAEGPPLADGLAQATIVLPADRELFRPSPIVAKHHKLARTLLSAGFARDLKPDVDERAALAMLCALPPTQPLKESERELIWKFRYSLVPNKGGLTKMLRCVDWGDAREAAGARQLAAQWAAVPVGELLELLGDGFANAAPWVRVMAVEALAKRASDAQLLTYLLPLVQAIQYERDAQRHPAEGPLASLLILRALSAAAATTAEARRKGAAATREQSKSDGASLPAGGRTGAPPGCAGGASAGGASAGLASATPTSAPANPAVTAPTELVAQTELPVCLHW